MMYDASMDFASGDAAAVSRAWCPDDGSRDNVLARRNVLAAFWAGRLMGLSGESLTAYAAEVHRADFTVPGDADVVDKIMADLRSAGIPIPVSELRSRLSGFHREALTQTHATD